MPQSSPPISNLSPRQREILELIRQGKSNNEIAFELGIGLGTVKQHVVALFRKLKVSRRTMALSRGHEQASLLSQAMSFSPSEIILQRRPCIVLSMTMEAVSPEALRTMKTAMAIEAQETSDIFLPWRASGCDVILGIEQATETAPLRALQIAWQTARKLADTSSGNTLKGGLAAGLAVASMHRRGGWSGEAIASSAIVLARQHAQAAEPGTLHLDAAVTDLLRLCGAYIKTGAPLFLPLDAPQALLWHESSERFRFYGRESELDDLQDLLTESPQSPSPKIHSVGGEAGIGKSRLCAEFTQICRKAGHPVRHLRCLPSIAPSPFWDVYSGHACTWEALHKPLASDGHEILVVDDAHWLTEEQKEVCMALPATRLVMYLAQRKQTDGATRLVPPLGTDDIEEFAMNVIPEDAVRGDGRLPEISRSIAALAGGNPLYAQEMARNHLTVASLASGNGQARKYLPLNLLLLVTANLDQAALDRRMLGVVASKPKGVILQDLVHDLSEDEHSVKASVDEAVKEGVLFLSETRRIGFVHPMFHSVIHYLGMES